MSSDIPTHSVLHTRPPNAVTSPNNRTVSEQADPRDVSRLHYHGFSGEHITDRPFSPTRTPQPLACIEQPGDKLPPIRRRSNSPAISSSSRPKKKRMRVSSRRADEEATAEGGHERASASPSPSLSSSDDDGYDHDRDDEDDEGQDHETGAIHGQPSAPAAPGTAASGAPPKKKRTRTLTTPYQAQRLHELLAKSRFPTTAERESIGREIGLTPRKVQVWFQNQRQKAKKPKGDLKPPMQPLPGSQLPHGYQSVLPGPGPTSHTSMHGVFQPHARPFMEGASSGIPIRDIAPAPSSSSQSRRPSDLPSGVVYSATHAGSSYAPRPTRLVGPGVPGDEVLPSGRMISPPPSTYPHPGRASVSGHGGYTTHSEGHSQSDNRARPEETVYRQRSSAHLQSVQLPPLHLDSRIARERRTSHDTQQAGSRALHSPPIPPSTAGHSASPYSSRHRVLPPLHVPEQAPQPLSRPYALEPNPQWHSDRGMHTSVAGPSSQPSPRHGSEYESSRRSAASRLTFDPVRSSASTEGASGTRRPPSRASDRPRESRSPRH